MDSPDITVEDLQAVLVAKLGAKNIPAKVAAGLLKASSERSAPVEKVVSAPTGVDALASILKDIRPIEQRESKELLELFVVNRSVEIEEELTKRAKGQRFIVIKPGKYEPGKEEIDVEKSLDLLRMARRGKTVPSTTAYGNVFVTVYRITELNQQDRMVELCPICGAALYQGYCEKCQVKFNDVDDDARAYVRLIADSDNFDKKSSVERKAVVANASKGVDDLKQYWPSLAQKFDDLKATGSLPSLRPLTSTTVADPFFAGGNRKFVGNQSY